MEDCSRVKRLWPEYLFCWHHGLFGGYEKLYQKILVFNTITHGEYISITFLVHHTRKHKRIFFLHIRFHMYAIKFHNPPTAQIPRAKISHFSRSELLSTKFSNHKSNKIGRSKHHWSYRSTKTQTNTFSILKLFETKNAYNYERNSNCIRIIQNLLIRKIFSNINYFNGRLINIKINYDCISPHLHLNRPLDESNMQGCLVFPKIYNIFPYLILPILI